MAYSRSDELFSDGWREPSDDCERMANYIVFGFGTIVGLALFGYGIWILATGAARPVRLMGLFEALVGALMGGGGIVLFAKEWKHWDLRHLTADRFVAGGFLFGFALMLLGAQIATRTGSVGSHVQSHGPHDFESGMIVCFGLFALGAVDVTLFLIVGLIFAYAPHMRLRHRLARTRIERRYAVDEKLNEIDDHPCPREDGLTPVVTLRLRDGRTRTLVCHESTYELVRVGRQGTAVVRGRRLERFL